MYVYHYHNTNKVLKILTTTFTLRKLFFQDVSPASGSFEDGVMSPTLLMTEATLQMPQMSQQLLF
jgi:hypothetical protein